MAATAFNIQKPTCHANMVLEIENDFISKQANFLVLSICLILRSVITYFLFVNRKWKSLYTGFELDFNYISSSKSNQDLILY